MSLALVQQMDGPPVYAWPRHNTLGSGRGLINRGACLAPGCVSSGGCLSFTTMVSDEKKAFLKVEVM
jgi:hypothetical protein